MNIQILISKNSWAAKYKQEIKKAISKYGKKLVILDNHKRLRKNFQLNIIFSYFKIIDYKYLKRSNHNLVLHESDLPKGRGMSPVSWSILKGAKKLTFSLIEANNTVDGGKIYFKKKVKVNELLIFDEIKKTQLKNNIFLLEKFLKHLRRYKKSPKALKQKGRPTFFKLRTPKDSKLNVNKSLKSQFNLMRICDYDHYPSYFIYKGKKFKLKLEKV